MYRSGFTNLINNWGGSLNFLDNPYFLTDSFCIYYDKKHQNIENCWARDEGDTQYLSIELDITTYFRILVIGKPDYYKTKFVHWCEKRHLCKKKKTSVAKKKTPFAKKCHPLQKKSPVAKKVTPSKKTHII